eukprot:101566-Rhodomonas_salina.1
MICVRGEVPGGVSALDYLSHRFPVPRLTEAPDSKHAFCAENPSSSVTSSNHICLGVGPLQQSKYCWQAKE